MTNVNDNAPTIADQTFSIPEDANNGTAVGTVQAADADMDNLTFSITSGNTGNVFAISEGTGAITVAGALDFEITQSYTLKVSVSDGSLSATADITVNVTDVDETAATRKEIADLLSTLEKTQDGHLQTTGITNAQMKIAALKMESSATAATYKAAIDAIVAVTTLDDATLTALQGEIDAITQKITDLENAGNAPAGTIPPLKTSLEALKTTQAALTNGAPGLTTELRKITVSEETKTMALQTELNKLIPNYTTIITLINEGADVNAKDNKSRTALFLAARDGQIATVNALLEVSGINVNIQNNINSTALIAAAFGGHTTIVNALLAVSGINVNLRGAGDDTALHFATRFGYKATIEALLEVSDIEVNAINSLNSLTPLDYVNLLPDSDDKNAIIEALRSKGTKTKADIDGE
ncbi:MAG: ankyrin repeat domain-containing protein [Ekhidna sp.]|nr:ankyrin repeat domain-containing protein [Ekhidna sp.]